MALCGLRWRDQLVWAAAEALHFMAVWLYVGGLSRPDRGLPATWYAVFLVLRVAAVASLVWQVWRRAARRVEPLWLDGQPWLDEEPGQPENDSAVDELSGDLGDARDVPDRFVVRLD